MARKFTRNITGTNLRKSKGKTEPFTTNIQNDLLSDETDIYIRQEKSNKIDDKYHCLTDDVKEVISKSDLITTENFDMDKDSQDKKGKSYINVNKSSKQESEEGTLNNKVMTPLQTKHAINKQVPPLVKEHETPTKLTSLSEELEIEKKAKNDFELKLQLDEYAKTDYVDNKVDSIDIPEVDLSDYATKVYVNEKVDSIEIPKVDLSEYIKKNKIRPEFYLRREPTGSYILLRRGYISPIYYKFPNESTYNFVDGHINLGNSGLLLPLRDKSGYSFKTKYIGLDDPNLNTRFTRLSSIGTEYIMAIDLPLWDVLTEEERNEFINNNLGEGSDYWIPLVLKISFHNGSIFYYENLITVRID